MGLDGRFFQKGKIKKIKRYFLYHHKNTHPGKKSHRKYLLALDVLEQVSPIDFSENDKNIIAKMKENIGLLTFEQINQIYELIQSKI